MDEKMTLDMVRQEIDAVDAQMKTLFIKRMALAEQVAKVKARTGDQIYKGDREVAIIEKAVKDMDPSIVKQYTAFVKKLMTVSREYQYNQTITLRGLELKDCVELGAVVPEQNHNRVKFAFCGSNEAESLSKVLSIIGDYGVNITETKITSAEGIRFELVMEGNLLNQEIQALIYQIAQETTEFVLISSFEAK